MSGIVSAALGAVVIAMTVGEPSHGRRSAGLVAGFVCVGVDFLLEIRVGLVIFG